MPGFHQLSPCITGLVRWEGILIGGSALIGVVYPCRKNQDRSVAKEMTDISGRRSRGYRDATEP
jgi:hypothetical protein